MMMKTLALAFGLVCLTGCGYQLVQKETEVVCGLGEPVAIGDRGVAVQSAVAEQGYAGDYQVSLKLTDSGSNILAEVTAANLGQPLDLTVGGEVVMSPRVMEPILQGNLVVSGRFTQAEADALAHRMAPPCG